MGLRAELHRTKGDASLHFEHMHAYEYRDRIGELPFRPAALGAMGSDLDLRARAFEPGAASVPERAATLDYDYLRPAQRLDGKGGRFVSQGAEASQVFDYQVKQPQGDMNLRALRLLEARQGATARMVITTTGTIRPGVGLTLTDYPGGDLELLSVAARTKVAQRSDDGPVERRHEVEAVWRPLRIRLQPPAKLSTNDLNGRSTEHLLLGGALSRVVPFAHAPRPLAVCFHYGWRTSPDAASTSLSSPYEALYLDPCTGELVATEPTERPACELKLSGGGRAMKNSS